MLAITGGTAVGQVLALIAAPVLTRLFTPEQFGVFSVVAASIVILGTVAAFRLELAIALPDRDSDGYALTYVALTLAAMTTAVSLALLFPVRLAFDAVGVQPWSVSLMVLIPLGAMAFSWCIALNQLAVRQQRFGAIGKRNAFLSGATVGSQVGLGAAGTTAIGLPLGMAIGQFAGAFSLLAGVSWRSDAAIRGRRRRRLLAVVRRYRRFPLLMVPAGFLNVVGQQLPVVCVAYAYGVHAAGFFGLAQRILALPVTLVGTAAAHVFMSRLAKMVREGEPGARAVFLRATRGLSACAALMVLGLFVAGPPLFGLLFGAVWTESGEIARAMSLGVAAQFVASPLSQTLIVYEQQGRQLMWDASRAIVLVGVFAVAMLLGVGVVSLAWIWSVALTLLYGWSWVMSERAVRKSVIRTSF